MERQVIKRMATWKDDCELVQWFSGNLAQLAFTIDRIVAIVIAGGESGVEVETPFNLVVNRHGPFTF
jgi:hypothetical protein